jgi:Ca2+-binding EF-hand superfamily protein
MSARSSFWIAAGSLLLGSSALAQGLVADGRFQVPLQGEMTREAYLEAARSRFSRLDQDGDGRVTPDDATLRSSLTAAAMRSQKIAAMLTFDLDGDLVVTADEYDRATRQRRAHPAGANVGNSIKASFDALDADRDGRLTVDELAKGSDRQQSAAGARSAADNDAALLFDRNADKAVTSEEYLAAHEAYFKNFDINGDGTLSGDEVTAADGALRDARAVTARAQAEQRAAAACALPKAPQNAKIIAIGAYETNTLSNMALGSQDQVTQAGTIDIEPGSEPLYLLVTSYEAVIWTFTGAVDRVQHLVLSSSQGARAPDGFTPFVGAVGVDPARISYARAHNCLPPFHETSEAAKAAIARAIEAAVGRRPDAIAGDYTAVDIKVPSLRKSAGRPASSGTALVLTREGGIVRVTTKPGGGATTAIRNAQQSLLRYSPGGVTEIDGAKVQSAAKVEPYEVLPQEAGLLQLLQSGALERDRTGPFIIRQQIRFPAGLAGAHAVAFQLAEGVPAPQGSPAHSSVQGANGETIHGTRRAQPPRPRTEVQSPQQLINP